MRILGVIPARYASSRLPGKPLVDINGRSMVMRVMDRAKCSEALTDVVVATDDQRIFDHVAAHNGEVVMTSPDHRSGTDRCWEAVSILGAKKYDAVVNIQGDEPFIVPEQIDQVCAMLKDPDVSIVTLAQVITDDRDLDDTGEVKITVSSNMDALYFSRAAIPFLKDPGPGTRSSQFRFLKHVGLYGYNTDQLAQLVAKKPSSLELAESLEQLRWIEEGWPIRIGITDHPSFCVDTPADLEEARRRVTL